MFSKVVFTLLLSAYVKAYSQSVVDKRLITPVEKSNFIATATYNEAIEFYSLLDSLYLQAALLPQGLTDSGKPLHLFLISKEGLTNPGQLGNRAFVLIINAIHPGESDGVDASMLLSREILTQKNSWNLLDSVVIGIVPFYNIGGALNRGCCTRANQNGPIEYGFRGNARNFDLNRDFIKADTRNTSSFQEMFNQWKPHLFIDTHVSNGADYQYTLSYIASVKEKLGPIVGTWFHENFIPRLGKAINEEGYEIIPYVDFNEVPEYGMNAFYDAARYSTGYAALFRTPGFMIETHMLKPYKSRVKATKVFMEEAIRLVLNSKNDLQKAINSELERDLKQSVSIINWKQDTTFHSNIKFKGYESNYKKSTISGLNRLYYDRNKPFIKDIPYYNRFVPQDSVVIPEAYIIPEGWHTVVQQLKNNGIEFSSLTADTAFEVEVYQINTYQTIRGPYEGHYMHTNVTVSTGFEKKQFFKGDLIVPTRQKGIRYIIEVLEPRSRDSFFKWNYLDIILQAKEGFSDYVFEETAEELLKENPNLKSDLIKKQREDSVFASNHFAQLQFIYSRSRFAEPAYMRYPIYRAKTQNLKPNKN